MGGSEYMYVHYQIVKWCTLDMSIVPSLVLKARRLSGPAFCSFRRFEYPEQALGGIPLMYMYACGFLDVVQDKTSEFSCTCICLLLKKKKSCILLVLLCKSCREEFLPGLHGNNHAHGRAWRVRKIRMNVPSLSIHVPAKVYCISHCCNNHKIIITVLSHHWF